MQSVFFSGSLLAHKFFGCCLIPTIDFLGICDIYLWHFSSIQTSIWPWRSRFEKWGACQRKTVNDHSKHIAVNKQTRQLNTTFYHFFYFNTSRFFLSSTLNHILFRNAANPKKVDQTLNDICATQPIPKKPGKSNCFPPSRGAGATTAKKGGNMKVNNFDLFNNLAGRLDQGGSAGGYDSYE